MALRAGFAEVDITPEVGTEKVGWLRRIVADTVLDPLYARAMVLECNGTRLGLVSLDVLSVSREQVSSVRAAAAALGIPESHLMVAATHNHAGPAVCSSGPTKRDDQYVALMLERTAQALREAVSSMVPARLGIASATEGRLSFIRRYIMKDGSVCTHPPSASPEIRCAEGVIDPQVGVLCLKGDDDKVFGFAVNFACHPTQHGGDTCISAGYPGQLSLALKGEFGDGCVALFLNGAFGNIHAGNPLDPEFVEDMHGIGATLAEDVCRLVPEMAFTDSVSLAARTTTLRLPIRDLDGSYGRAAKYQQMFAEPEVYEDMRRKLAARKAERDHEEAEVQCLTMGDETAFVGIPAEYFAQLGLRIKIESRVPNTYVVGAANGMLGYVPHREAFE
ncbi:MAG: hypothetical protein ACE5R4_12750, partial [Armatimonadota bacterium]